MQVAEQSGYPGTAIRLLLTACATDAIFPVVYDNAAQFDPSAIQPLERPT